MCATRCKCQASALGSACGAFRKKDWPMSTIYSATNPTTLYSRAQNRVELNAPSVTVPENLERACPETAQVEAEPCSWTVHVAVRDSVERELILPPFAT